jgi:hypothetical protein
MACNAAEVYVIPREENMTAPGEEDRGRRGLCENPAKPRSCGADALVPDRVASVVGCLTGRAQI